MLVMEAVMVVAMVEVTMVVAMEVVISEEAMEAAAAIFKSKVFPVRALRCV